MNKYTFNNQEYYLADDVYKTEPESFVGCSKTSRLIVKNKKLKPEEYIYKKYIKSKNEWLDSEEAYKSAKVFIIADWVHNNLIMFKPEKTEEDFKIEAMKPPPILKLTDDEKFVDIYGNKLDIEVRGTKEMNNIYFKVIDVANKFKLGDVKTILLNSDSSFRKELHYKLFKLPKVIDPDCNSIKKGQKALFLTFKGLTKLLYVSHSKNAEHFQDWANKLLFTHQLGTKEQKTKLANKLLGANISDVKTVFNASSYKIGAIYLITLGYVKDLRNTFNIVDSFDDNHVVVKYGRTDDLKRRLSELQIEYNKFTNVNVMLKLYSYIDNDLAPKAEHSIKTILEFTKNTLPYPGHNELAIINPDNFGKFKTIYDDIRMKYAGPLADYIHKITNLEKDHQMEIMKLEHQNALLQKENEILQLKLQLLNK
jgi:hypothetical protein